MKKKFLALLTVACAACATVPAFAADASSTTKLDDRLDAARTVVQQIEATPDKAIPEYITSDAKCVGVVPGLLKGAFIFGAEYGQGVVTCRTGHGWSAPVFIRMTGGSWGFQIGGSGTDLVMVAVNTKGMQDLIKSQFKIGATAAASAGPVGREAQAATNWKLNSELLTWSRSKGLFAGVDLSGVVVNANQADTDKFYGAHHTFEDILAGHVPPPAAARPFLRTIAQYFHTSKENS
jgi:lipid-binding SYLF domain-containing protein